MKDINKIPKYIKKIINFNPKIVSGRKNFEQYEKRLKKIYNLIKNFKKINN